METDSTTPNLDQFYGGPPEPFPSLKIEVSLIAKSNAEFGHIPNVGWLGFMVYQPL